MERRVFIMAHGIEHLCETIADESASFTQLVPASLLYTANWTAVSAENSKRQNRKCARTAHCTFADLS